LVCLLLIPICSAASYTDISVAQEKLAGNHDAIILLDVHNHNTNNAFDDGNNTWDIAKTDGTNIIGGSWLGGNYLSDYTGNDSDGDGLGNTLLPYNSSCSIQNGGDYLPLVKPSAP